MDTGLSTEIVDDVLDRTTRKEPLVSSIEALPVVSGKCAGEGEFGWSSVKGSLAVRSIFDPGQQNGN